MRWVYLMLALIFVGGALSLNSATAGLKAGPQPTTFTGSPPAGSVWWVGASSSDSSALPNTGVQSDIQVINFASTGCLAFWIADGLPNDEWGQVGYYLCSGEAPVSFYQVWNLGSQTILAGGMGSITTGTHTFSMYLQSGTTWAYSVDGTVMGTFDMGASASSSSYPVEAFSEEQASSVFSFPAVTFSNTMQALQSGTWGPVQTAVSYGTAWGVQGNLQNSNLQNDEIIIGGSVSALPAGTLLWGPGSTSSTSSSTSMDPPTVTVTVTSTVTQTSTQTSTTTVTSTLPATTTTVTSTTTSPPVTTTQTVTQTQTSTVTSTSTLPGSTSTTTVTSTSPPVTTTQTSTQTVTQTTTATSTQTLPVTSTTTTTVTSIPPPVTITQTSTATATVTSTTVQTATVTNTLTSTVDQTSTVTSTSTTTIPGGTTTVTGTGATTTVTSVAPLSTTTVTSTSIGTVTTTQAPTTSTKTQTVTATTTVCVSGSSELQVSCPTTGSNFQNNAGSPLVLLSDSGLVVLVGALTVGAVIARRVTRSSRSR